MKISPLQLENYFLTDLHVSVNKSFDPAKTSDFQDKDIIIDVDCVRIQEDLRRWQVLLKVQKQSPADANVSYSFVVELVGVFRVLEGYPEEKIDRLIRTNGPSMLYGIARETVRDFTSRGPFLPVMLPSASFYQSETKTEAK